MSAEPKFDASTESALTSVDASNPRKPWQFKPGQSGNPGGKPGWYQQVVKPHRDNMPMLLNALYAFAMKSVREGTKEAIPATKLYVELVAGKSPNTGTEQAAIVVPNAKENVDRMWASMSNEQIDAVINGDGKMPEDASSESAEPDEKEATG